MSIATYQPAKPRGKRLIVTRAGLISENVVLMLLTLLHVHHSNLHVFATVVEKINK